MVKINEMLDKRFELCLEWHEPWSAVGPEGNKTIDAHITLRATVHDCINLSRKAAKDKGLATMGNDAVFLQQFIDLHFAYAVANE